MLNDIRRNVEWSDLKLVNSRESLREILLSLPWLLLSLVLAYLGLYILALGASFMFFMTGLRQVHDVFHNTLRLTRWGNYLMLYFLSCLMLGSMHSVKINHLRHHRYCLEEEDMEGRAALMPWWKVIFLFGPVYPILHHYNALKVGRGRDRYKIIIELMSNAIILYLVFGILDSAVLTYHYSAMIVAQLLSVFFAVWTVHHDADDHILQARTIRNPIKSNITYQLFYHAEHHLFPAVPTKYLPELARRIDDYLPELEKRMVY